MDPTQKPLPVDSKSKPHTYQNLTEPREEAVSKKAQRTLNTLSKVYDYTTPPPPIFHPSSSKISFGQKIKNIFMSFFSFKRAAWVEQLSQARKNYAKSKLDPLIKLEDFANDIALVKLNLRDDENMTSKEKTKAEAKIDSYRQQISDELAKAIDTCAKQLINASKDKKGEKWDQVLALVNVWNEEIWAIRETNNYEKNNHVVNAIARFEETLVKAFSNRIDVICSTTKKEYDSHDDQIRDGLSKLRLNLDTIPIDEYSKLKIIDMMKAAFIR